MENNSIVYKVLQKYRNSDIPDEILSKLVLDAVKETNYGTMDYIDYLCVQTLTLIDKIMSQYLGKEECTKEEIYDILNRYFSVGSRRKRILLESLNSKNCAEDKQDIIWVTCLDVYMKLYREKCKETYIRDI